MTKDGPREEGFIALVAMDVLVGAAHKAKYYRNGACQCGGLSHVGWVPDWWAEAYPGFTRPDPAEYNPHIRAGRNEAFSLVEGFSDERVRGLIRRARERAEAILNSLRNQ